MVASAALLTSFCFITMYFSNWETRLGFEKILLSKASLETFS